MRFAAARPRTSCHSTLRRCPFDRIATPALTKESRIVEELTLNLSPSSANVEPPAYICAAEAT